jgi:hypothetical protein
VKFGNEIRRGVDKVLDCDLGCGFCGAAGGYKFVESLGLLGNFLGETSGSRS